MEGKSELKLKLQWDSHERARETWVEAEITRGDRGGLVKEDRFITQAPPRHRERDRLLILYSITRRQN